MTKMCKSSIYFGVVILVLITTVKTETNSSECEQKEKHEALLDLAKVSIDKVKDLDLGCDNDSRNVSTNSSECGLKEKVSAYLDAAKDLIDEARSNYSACNVTNNVTEIVVFKNFTEVVVKEVQKRPADCSEVLENGEDESGVYRIWPRSRILDGRSLQVYCDMDTDGGGWTVIQRREDAPKKIDFYRDWKTYKLGFGNITGEFWIGNDIIFALTNQRQYSLRFDMQNISGESRFAIYSSFWIEDESADYTLHIGNYNGTAGDGIRDTNNTKFSTKDKRNDKANHVCTEQKKGGWWYKDCSRSNPNGLNVPSGKDDPKYINWYPWTNYDALLAIEMKIR